MGKYSASDIADFFLCNIVDMTQKKLHKMLFFSYAWYLYLNNDKGEIVNRLFEPKIKNEGFQAWVHGPVYRELYPKYSKYGFKPINILNFDQSVIDNDDIIFLNEIIDVFGKLPAEELERQSHNFTAWKKARKGLGPYDVCKNLLDDNDIYDDIEAIDNNE